MFAGLIGLNQIPTETSFSATVLLHFSLYPMNFSEG